jgi:ribonuclease P protein component
MERLRHRAQFLAAAAGVKVPMAAFVLQACRRNDEGPARVGFTVSKKIGTAVERNRVRRRLKEVVRRSAAARMRAGHDYVIVGRWNALILPYVRLVQDFEQSLMRLDSKYPMGLRHAGGGRDAESPATTTDDKNRR